MNKELSPALTLTVANLPKPDLTIVTPLSVTHNMVAIKDAITAITDGIKQTDYDDAEAKKVKADLNKARDVVKTAATQFKTDCMKPIDDVLEDFKVIDGMLVGAYDVLNVQVAASMARRKEERQRLIEGLFADAVSTLLKNGDFEKAGLEEVPGWITLLAIQQPDWTNLSRSMVSIKGEIFGRLDRILSEYGTIQAMPDSDRAIVADVFAKTLNLSAGLAELTRFRRQQELAEQAKNPPVQTPPAVPPAPPAASAPPPASPSPAKTTSPLDEVLNGSLSVGRGSFTVTGTRGAINYWIKSAASLGVTISKVGA